MPCRHKSKISQGDDNSNLANFIRSVSQILAKQKHLLRMLISVVGDKKELL